MNTSIQATIAQTQSFLAALANLSDEPAARPFRFSGTGLHTNLLQFFPPLGVKEGDDSRAIAKPFARLLGGTWTAHGDTWECDAVEYPGLAGTKVVLHYIEPRRSPVAVDLSEPEEREPDYDAPRPLTPLENWQRNDEHHVA